MKWHQNNVLYLYGQVSGKWQLPTLNRKLSIYKLIQTPYITSILSVHIRHKRKPLISYTNILYMINLTFLCKNIKIAFFYNSIIKNQKYYISNHVEEAATAVSNNLIIFGSPTLLSNIKSISRDMFSRDLFSFCCHVCTTMSHVRI